MTDERYCKPTVFLSKGQREEKEQVIDLEIPLIEVWKGLYEWRNLPEGLDSDMVQVWIWEHGLIGGLNVQPFGNMLYPAQPKTLNPYGHIATWKPVTLNPTTDNIQRLISGEYDTPVLEMIPMHALIQPYLETMTHALLTLKTDLIALRTPVLLDGEVGAEISALAFGADLRSGELVIPTIKSSMMQAKALDLGARDNTINLMATYNEMLKQCLSIMGIGGAFGSSKQSGLSTTEVVASDNPTNIVAWKNLKKMQDFCEKVNAALGTDIQVDLGEGYRPTYKEIEEEEDPEGPEADTDTNGGGADGESDRQE